MSLRTSQLQHDLDSRWSATLVNNLLNIADKISLWQRAVQGKHEYMSSEQIVAAQRCRTWYQSERDSRSYACKEYRLAEEKKMLLAEFKKDPNYHIKNMAELMVRTLVSAILHEKGIDAKAYITTDADDAFAGLDIVVELINQDEDAENEYFGIDLAITKNPEYLLNKYVWARAMPVEFNMAKGRWKEDLMPRIVLPIFPNVMESFASDYMAEVTRSEKSSIDRAHALVLFKNACVKRSVSFDEIINGIVNRVTPFIP